MSEFTRFEYQYIVMLASRAKRDLMSEIEEEREKMKKYNTTESFLDPNINGYTESLQAIIQKAKESMNKIDREEFRNS